MLAELKVLSCCPTRYSPTSQVRAVDRRARALNGEYLSKAREVDRQFGGVLAGTVGPVQRRLERFGEVKGWFLVLLEREVRMSTVLCRVWPAVGLGSVGRGSWELWWGKLGGE